MGTKTKVLDVSEVAVGQSKCVKAGGQDIAIFRQEESYFALENTCPHKGGPLSEGFVENGQVTCPWHNWQFNLADGACPMVPGRPVKSFPVEIKDDAIWITV
jgi:NAD(P)H-dependent nitrite reductase small subunit